MNNEDALSEFVGHQVITHRFEPVPPKGQVTPVVAFEVGAGKAALDDHHNLK